MNGQARAAQWRDRASRHEKHWERCEDGDKRAAIPQATSQNRREDAAPQDFFHESNVDSTRIVKFRLASVGPKITASPAHKVVSVKLSGAKSPVQALLYIPSAPRPASQKRLTCEQNPNPPSPAFEGKSLIRAHSPRPNAHTSPTLSPTSQNNIHDPPPIKNLLSSQTMCPRPRHR